jgi:hypothetical protein
MISKRIVFLILGLLVPFNVLFPQNSYRNSVFLEALGPGYIYSINYERFVGDNLSLRAGFTSLTNSKYAWLFDEKDIGSYTTFSFMLNYLLGALQIGESHFQFEVGAGLAYVKFENNTFYGPLFNPSAPNLASSSEGSVMIGSIGLRHQFMNSRIQQRISLTPLIGPNGKKLFFGCSIGYLF